MEKYGYWLKNVTAKERVLLEAMTKDEIEDAFYKDLEFGTAGLRGLAGLGSNRINNYTVIKVSQGIADYLAENKNAHRICISYDSRHNSKEFAFIAARVFTLNGIEAVVSKKLAPTPYLSYMVRKFKADAGVMITASHNTKEYNGYKVYGADGCQINDAAASRLKGFIDKVNAFEIKLPTFLHCAASRKIKLRSIKRDYLNQVKHFLDKIELLPDAAYLPNAAHLSDAARSTGIKVTFTALNGTGGEYAADILKHIGANRFFVEEQIKPDGDFATCPAPNPEADSAFNLSLKYAQQNGSDIILATDPDADRAGVMVKQGDKYVRLTGNETGALLAEFLLRKIKKNNATIVRTLVTTSLVDKIAAKYGAKVQKTFTGFKYIGEYVSKMDKEGRLNDFLLGFEDSAGYLASTYARDKDGVLASGLICLMAQEYKQNGKTLLDGLNDLHKEFGLHINKTLAFKFAGINGSKKIYDIMDTLRNKNAANSIFSGIKEKIDFMNPDNPVSKTNGLPLTNMIGLIADDYAVYVRPSGTEPLIKVYIMTENSAAPLDEIINSANTFFV